MATLYIGIHIGHVAMITIYMTWICSVLDWKPCLVCPEHGNAHLGDYYYLIADDALTDTRLGLLDSSAFPLY
jgi:hypothetical protein